MRRVPEGIILHPDSFLWQLPIYDFPLEKSIHTYEVRSLSFPFLEEYIFQSDQYKTFDDDWQARTRKLVGRRRVLFLAPRTRAVGEETLVYVVLPDLTDFSAEEYWGRRLLPMKIDGQLIESASF